MVSFLALYRGDSIGTAELVAVTTNQRLIATIATELLSGRDEEQFDADDPAVAAVKRGRRRALELVRHEATDTQDEEQAPST